MKAWNLYGPNDIRYEDKEIAAPRPGEVQLKVCAAGICGSDVPRVFLTGAHRSPLIPGHEFAGAVMAAGGPEGEAWTGKRVGVFPLIPCKKCPSCLDKKYEMCSNYDYLGSRSDGAFAEYVNVPVWNLIELPDDVSFDRGMFLEPLAVAVHAIRQVLPGLGKGDKSESRQEKIVIAGFGTIGRLLFSVLKREGYKDIIVVGNKPAQQQAAVRLGLDPDMYIDSKAAGSNAKVADMIRELTGGRGADIFFEVVGRQEVAGLSLEASGPSGRIVFVGNPASDMTFPREVYWQILRKQLDIHGTWNSSFTGEEDDDWHYAMEVIKDKSFPAEELITHRVELSELMTGLEIMRDKTEDYCKIMVCEKK